MSSLSPQLLKRAVLTRDKMANILARVNGVLCVLVIVCVLQSMASASLLPLITDEISSPWITLNSPLIHCTLESVLPPGFVFCPTEERALVVQGDYGEAYINCSASLEVQFKFEGITPTAAIHVDYLNFNIEEGLKTYNTHVRISSIATVWREALRLNPEKGALPNALNYSRTGKYTFEGRESQYKSIKKVFYIFFEEPGAKPEFIRREQMGVILDDSNQYASVPCLPTHYSASVQLKPADQLQLSNTNYLTTKHKYSVTSYTCTLTYGNQTDVLSFDLSQNEAPKDTGPSSKNMLTFINGKATEDYKDDAMASCKNILGSPQPMSLSIQYFSTKYDYESLYKFVLPKYRGRSHSVITKVANSSDALSIVSVNLTRGRTGVISCGNDEYLDVTDFSVDFKGQVHNFSHKDVDFYLKHFKEEILRDPGRILRISLSQHNENSVTFAGDDVSFSCHFDSFYLCSPRTWITVYSNGASVVLGEEYVTESHGVSNATVRLHLGMTQVSCNSAICTSTDDIVSISKAVTVQPRPTTPSTVPSSSVSSLAESTPTISRTTMDTRSTGSGNRTSGVNSTELSVQEESIEPSTVNEAAAAFVVLPILLAIIATAVYYYMRRRATLALSV